VSLTRLPSLDQLAGDLARARELPPNVARDLLPRVIGLQTVLLARALSAPDIGNGQPETSGEGDRLLDVQAAAAKLGTSRDWLYRQARNLPFTVRLGSRLRFSERGMERYIRQREGRG
jgi:predicted DNA-binding transcriptional regulator AlpA